MLALWAGASLFFVLRREWAGLGVLTLTVAAAIVQLRWLASQVSGLVFMALRPPDPHGVDGPAEAPVEDPDLAQEPAEPIARRRPIGPLQNGVPDESCGVDDSDAENAPDLRDASVRSGETSQFTEQGAIEPVRNQQPRTTAIVLMRPIVLLGTLLVVFALGSSQPIALTIGALTLPVALIVEAARAANRSGA